MTKKKIIKKISKYNKLYQRKYRLKQRQCKNKKINKRNRLNLYVNFGVVKNQKIKIKENKLK